MSSGRERRKYPRLAVQLGIRFKRLDEAEDSFMKEITNSLGKGGLFIRTKKPFPIKSEIDIELTVKNKTINAQGVVRYIVPFDENGGVQFPGMGIQFTMIPTDDQEYISDFVNNGLKKSTKTN